MVWVLVLICQGSHIACLEDLTWGTCQECIYNMSLSGVLRGTYYDSRRRNLRSSSVSLCYMRAHYPPSILSSPCILHLITRPHPTWYSLTIRLCSCYLKKEPRLKPKVDGIEVLSRLYLWKDIIWLCSYWLRKEPRLMPKVESISILSKLYL